VHASVAGPVSVCELQETWLKVAAGVDAVAGYRRMASVRFTLPAVAVNVTFSTALTVDAVTLKLAEVLPAITFADAGIFNALLLLESITKVSLVAAALKDTEQAMVVAPVTD